MDKQRMTELKVIAANVRKDALTAVHAAASGHPGGSLSIADVLTILYFEVMNINPENPKDPDRDRFVLSKGHCAPALYGVLAERGYFPREDMATFRKTGSDLQGHPDMKSVPGIDMSSGSLGQGVCAANGMALAGKIDSKPYRVYTILGDGELEEGQVWEAATFAAHQELGNLIAVVDLNGLQIDGKVDHVCASGTLAGKFADFGWEVHEVNGHDMDALIELFSDLKASETTQPKVVIAHTIKGKGVSFMEDQAGWHGKAPNDEETERALAELAEARAELNGVK